MRTPRPETEEKYREAIELYRTTGLPVREICARTGVPFTAFRSFLHSCHRELMFARYGMEVAPEEAAATRLRKRSGQTAASRAKYGEAIRACDDIAYIEYNVSQIAYMFHLDPSGLGSQLRNHYPEIIERRERERHRLGVNDNQHRGVKPWCKEQYAGAVEHLRTTDDTIRRTADLYGLSYSGLREHLLFYHKDLVRKRADKRERAKSGAKVRGALTGNGSRHEPKAGQTEKYREALRLYRDTALTHRQIAEATGITVTGLRNHLRIWNRRLIVEHRGYECREGEAVDLSRTKQYLKSTAAKYAGAIACLKETGRPTAEVAREFGLHPETFREYVREHEPELAARLGMTRLADGRQVLARSMEKYGEAVRLYDDHRAAPLHRRPAGVAVQQRGRLRAPQPSRRHRGAQPAGGTGGGTAAGEGAGGIRRPRPAKGERGEGAHPERLAADRRQQAQGRQAAGIQQVHPLQQAERPRAERHRRHIGENLRQNGSTRILTL